MNAVDQSTFVPNIRPDCTDALSAALHQRIMVIDGAMGTAIQRDRPDEAGYRGDRFTEWPTALQGNNALLNQPFVHAKVPIWSSTIIENVLKELAVINDEAAKKNLQKFKYIVNCQMQQRTGSAMITACACYWDKTTDGYCVNKWESDQIQVLVTVFGVAI